MSVSKSRPKSSKPKAAPKRLAFWCSLQDGYAHAEYRTAMLRPAEALQNMRNITSEMKAVMGLGSIKHGLDEPQWLTDAVDAEMDRIRKTLRRRRSVDVDDE